MYFLYRKVTQKMKDEIQKLIDKYEKDKKYLKSGVWYGDEIGYERDHAKIDLLEDIISDLKSAINDYEDQIKNDIIMKLVIDYEASYEELEKLSIEELEVLINQYHEDSSLSVK